MMLGFGIQDVLGLLLAAGALAWLVRRWLRSRDAKHGCEDCPSARAGAPACEQPPADQLVTIGSDRGPASPREPAAGPRDRGR